MYLSQKDIKALKVILESNNMVRVGGRKQRAIQQLSKSLQKNNQRIQQQRKMVSKMTRVPITSKNSNDPWD